MCAVARHTCVDNECGKRVVAVAPPTLASSVQQLNACRFGYPAVFVTLKCSVFFIAKIDAGSLNQHVSGLRPPLRHGYLG